MSGYRCRGYRAVSLFAVIMMGVVSAPISAHGPQASAVKVRMGPLPEAFSGLQAQVQTTVAPQMVVANDTARTLEVLDADGRAFLRVDQQGVRADLASPAWYRSQTAARGVPLPKGVSQDAQPRWAKVHGEAHWGWFDPRLRTDTIEVPHRVEHSGKPVDLQDWSVPVKLDGKLLSLKGAFRYEPLPPGAFQSRLVSDASPAKGVTVALSPGTVPAVHIHNEASSPVVVADASGRPHLRIGPGGSFLNANREPGPAQWVKVAGGSRYTWTEPRTTYQAVRPPDSVVNAGKRTQVASWSLPVTVGGKPVAVEGVVEWLPGDAVTAVAGHH